MKKGLILGIVLVATGFTASSAIALESKVIMTSGVEKTSIKVGENQSIFWKTENFPDAGFVHVNLIEKLGDSPIEYRLVKQISSYAVNDGEEVWTPERKDMKDNLYIEVTCAGSTRFKDGCSRVFDDTKKFAVKGSFTDNIANVFSSIFNIF